MYWPDTKTGVDVEPARKPVASAVRKFFTEGGLGQPPTVPGGDWFNQVTNELLNVLAAAGIDPSKVDDDQLLEAIQAIQSGGFTLDGTLAAAPEWKDVPAYEGGGPGGQMNEQAQAVLNRLEYLARSAFPLGTYAALRAFEGAATRVSVACRANIFDGGFGIFALDEADTTSADNDGTILVDALGRRWKRLQNGVFDAAWFGAAPSASASANATAIQKAMNLLSSGSGSKLRFSAVGTYTTNMLTPKPGVIIDLCGSTLFLANGVENPLFFDGGVAKPTKAKMFRVYNGTLDCNMAGNHAANLSGGAIWLTDWEYLEFDVTVTHAYRAAFNFWGCNHIKGKQWKFLSCGMNGDNTVANYSYGATFEPTCKNIDIGSIYVEDMYGFGVHFNRTEDYRLGGLTCKNITRGGSNSIALTTTQAKRGWIGIIDCDGVDGDNVEINATEDLRIDVIRTNAAGNRPLLFGDNNTGISNARVNIGSIVTTNTIGASSIGLNYMQNCTIGNGDLDKDIKTLANLPSDQIELSNLRIHQNMSSLIPFYPRFVAHNVIYDDFTITLANRFHCIVTPTTSGDSAKIVVLNGAAMYVDLSRMPDKDRPIAGKLIVISGFSSSLTQGTWQEVPFYFYETTLNIGTPLKLDGAIARQISVTADAANKRFVLTNSTGVDVTVSYRLEFM